MLRRHLWEITLILASIIIVYALVVNPSGVTSAQRLLRPPYPNTNQYGTWMPLVMNNDQVTPPYPLDVMLP